METFTYNQWRIDALFSLTQRYSHSDANIIVGWFDNISTQQEIDLVGADVYNCVVAITVMDENINPYNSLMMRLWLYAPYILEEAKNV